MVLVLVLVLVLVVLLVLALALGLVLGLGLQDKQVLVQGSVLGPEVSVSVLVLGLVA